MNNFEIPSEVIEESRKELFAKFKYLGIKAPTVPYPASQSVEEGKILRGQMSGTFTKNLLLKDKKDHLFLLSVFEDLTLDLKTLHKKIGANGRLGFASSELMIDLLGVMPGALTPLSIMNDINNRITVVIDASLMEAEQVNFHPLINTESTGLHPQELVKFIQSCEHEPVLVDFDADTNNSDLTNC